MFVGSASNWRLAFASSSLRGEAGNLFAAQFSSSSNLWPAASSASGERLAAPKKPRFQSAGSGLILFSRIVCAGFFSKPKLASLAQRPRRRRNNKANNEKRRRETIKPAQRRVFGRRRFWRSRVRRSQSSADSELAGSSRVREREERREQERVWPLFRAGLKVMVLTRSRAHTPAPRDASGA